jgi:tripeptide aminopeptidase
MREALKDRFFRYVAIDTQSKEGVEDRYPSTEKQKDLSRLLVEELKQLGLSDAAMDEHGLVMATLESNLPTNKTAKVPVIGLLAHVDTSPDVSGTGVKPVIHPNYQGEDIVLPGDTGQVIRVSENPELDRQIGHDIVTSDGATLLGADNKAGVAEIMTAVDHLLKHPELPHGKIRIGFTPDEEVGGGTKHFDIQRFGADIAYTVDGGEAGEVENETFNAASAAFTIHGVNVHPGYAKGKMVNAIRIAGEILDALKNDPAPETTEKHEGYLHPHAIEGGEEKTVLRLIVRDFETDGMEEKFTRLRTIRDEVAVRHPRARIELDIKHSYKNMRLDLEKDPRVLEWALESVIRTGLESRFQSIRGGTDGARLSEQGLPTPNLFTGGHNFHSRQEWVSLDDMEKAVLAIVNLVQIAVERSV